MTTAPAPWNLRRPTAFVFGGGAASTSAQVGMLAAVLEFGVRPDLIVGTSAGALNGVLLAEAPDSAVDRLTEIWTRCTRSQVISDSRLRVFRNLLGGHFMYRNCRLRELFTEHVSARAFDQLDTEFACAATDLDSGDPVLLHTGPLIDALLATCAIPGVFPLVNWNDRWLADGGYVANVPVRQAIELGAASIVVFDGRPRLVSRGELKDVRYSMTAAFGAALRWQYLHDIEYARSLVPILCLPGQADGHIKGFDFSQVGSMIRDAHEVTRNYLAGLSRNLVQSSHSTKH
jgi:NTE family protein